jgi:hypothetical protein
MKLKTNFIGILTTVLLLGIFLQNAAYGIVTSGLWVYSYIDCPIKWSWRQSDPLTNWGNFASDKDGSGTNCEENYVMCGFPDPGFSWGSLPMEIKMEGGGIEVIESVVVNYGEDTEYKLTIDKYPGTLFIEEGYLACPDQGKGGFCPASLLLNNDQESLNILRKFRDEKLAKTDKGRTFIKLYYQYGPLIYKILENNPDIKEKYRDALKKLIPIIKKII